MSDVIRQSTAVSLIVGPILDGDGAAVSDAAVGDLLISKNGGTPAGLDGSATLTHDHGGQYVLALTANDVDTVGRTVVTLDDETNVMQPVRLQVVEEAVYDQLYAASATGAPSETSIATATLTAADGIETGVTLQQAVQRIGATTAGKVSGAGTDTEAFVGLDGSTTRVVVTADEDGNRSDVSYDPGDE